jgi:hypothetical protein
VWDISSSWDFWFPNRAPEGDQVGFLWADSFVQTLGVVLAPNTTYTLQADFTHVPGFASEFTLELLAGGVSLGSAGGFPNILGVFDTATVVVITGAAPPQLGEALGIRISSTAAESDFDNVRLDASTLATAPDLSCSGFFSPLDNGPVPVKKNRALPFKARLTNSDNQLVDDLGIMALPIIQIFFDSVLNGAVDVTEDASSAGAGTNANQFEFLDTKWHFNIKTKNYSAQGTYTVTMESGDNSEYLIDPTCIGQFVIN